MRKKIFIFLKIDLLQIFYIFQKSHFGLIDELARIQQMTDVSARKIRTSITIAIFFDGAKVFSISFI